ncbi:MAG: acyltransferase family protein [Pyrinomonadaceae bacterium]
MPSLVQTETTGLGSSRLHSIDALRGIAALGVVFYHVMQPGSLMPSNNGLRYPVAALQFVSSFGYVGVFLFFVISGFCIHLQWARASAAGEAAHIRFGAFWKRRLRRLYPPYFIALALYVVVSGLSTGFNISHFFVYDIWMHLLMLHNLNPKTCYSINGVFWTLAIEEQLYLAYFLLLFLRTRLGWSRTLLICLVVRLGWLLLSHFLWLATGFGLPVPEAAASHWFTWALGAVGVEAMFGLIRLPGWLKKLWLSAALIIAASAISYSLPLIPKDTWLHNISWFLIHPLWGVGFLILVNRAVLAERAWVSRFRLPILVSLFATLGVFSYSIYLTHELVIIQSWKFVNYTWSPFANALLVIIPSTIIFAWLYFWFCERPYMRKSRASEERAHNTLEEHIATTLEPESA